MMMKVGIIGTGLMGKPMAGNLLKAGYPLNVYARHPEKVEDLKNNGARIVASPADVGAQSEVVILSLPFDPDVEEVMTGEGGILSASSPGTLILDTTTGTTEGSIRMAALAAEKRVGYLDAPISGGVQRATEGTLTFIVGGEKEHIEKVRPMMEKLGKNIFHVGPVGSGRTIKTLNQLISALNTLTLCETVVLGQMAGVNPETLYEVLSSCAANSYHLQTKLPNFIIPGKFEGGHRIAMMIKDLEIVLRLAKEKKTPTILTGLAMQLYRAGAGAGYAQKDISSMVNFFGSFVGLDFSKPDTP
jgi:2-hydroxymethylglutarate dehydrogenase